ncbi:alpha/beta hydrolase family protein [Rubripirellula lacrimiformis]|uniref:alpha/beta hydrolase family protein n=1 Tax=Rubripirellula lacrimiformis TaxID=1930273 RepID=UPI001C54F063|nr:alpha/beta hydrolase [Rubripirellula lacrimiformis]
MTNEFGAVISQTAPLEKKMHLRSIARATSFVMTIVIATTLAIPIGLAQTDTAQVAPVAEHIETWKGTLNLGAKLELGLKVYRQNDGTLSAKLDSYTQNALGIPVEFSRDGDKYKVSNKALGLEYEAQRSADKSMLKGVFKQGPVTTDLEFEKTDLNYEVKQNRPQTPTTPYPYDSSDVTFENKKHDLSLAGTLTIPRGDGPFAAAILITGSGPQNRDEELLGHRPFLVIADHLTRQGIAVLRFDDRGVGASTGDFSTATSEDFAEDVRSGMDFLKRDPKIDAAKIGLIGHSEGGLIAPMVAAGRDDLAFIVLLAGPGVDGARIIQTQQSAMLQAAGESPEAVTANQQLIAAVLDLMKSDDDVTATAINAACKSVVEEIQDEDLRKKLDVPLGAMFSTPWMQYFIRYDPSTNLQRVQCPVLAVNGTKDMQVLADLNLDAIEGALTKGGNQNFKVVRLPNQNHLFQETDGSGATGDYATIEQTFSPKTLAVISEWIAQMTK